MGYAVFALGSVLELAGYGVRLALSAPGGLFEIAAASYLLVKGFRAVPKIVADADLTRRSATAGFTTSDATS